jgi:hypothetical protein
MGMFLRPKLLIDTIRKIMNSFCGVMVEQPTGVSDGCLEETIRPQELCGMEFKDLTPFNASMLGKKAWEFQTNEDNLVSHLFKARYFPHSDLFGAEIETSYNYVWRSIFSAKNVVKQGTR